MTNDEIYITHPVTGESMDKSMCKRVITQLYEQREALEKQIDGLHDQIMNLPCLDQPGVERNSQIAYKTGHRDARHAAAELVAMIEAETKAKFGNTRVYPPEVQAAIERDTPKKQKRGDPFLCEGDEFICPSCDGHVRRSLLKGNCCCHCGQRLDWKERNTPQKLVKDIRSHHRCPTCESDLVKLIDEPTSCCPVCSQRLDWSE